MNKPFVKKYRWLFLLPAMLGLFLLLLSSFSAKAEEIEETTEPTGFIVETERVEGKMDLLGALIGEVNIEVGTITGITITKILPTGEGQEPMIIQIKSPGPISVSNLEAKTLGGSFPEIGGICAPSRIDWVCLEDVKMVLSSQVVESINLPDASITTCFENMCPEETSALIDLYEDIMEEDEKISPEDLNDDADETGEDDAVTSPEEGEDVGESPIESGDEQSLREQLEKALDDADQLGMILKEASGLIHGDMKNQIIEFNFILDELARRHGLIDTPTLEFGPVNESDISRLEQLFELIKKIIKLGEGEPLPTNVDIIEVLLEQAESLLQALHENHSAFREKMTRAEAAIEELYDVITETELQIENKEEYSGDEKTEAVLLEEIVELLQQLKKEVDHHRQSMMDIYRAGTQFEEEFQSAKEKYEQLLEYIANQAEEE